MHPALRQCSPADVVERLRPGMTVYVPGVSGESLPFYEALRHGADRTAGVTFVGVHFPGINDTDYLGLHPGARQRAYFMSSSVRRALGEGRADLIPLDYPGIVRDLEQHVAVDIAIAQVAPPDGQGLCSLGVSQDFTPSVWHRAALRVAHINPALPPTRGSFSIRATDCDLVFESASGVPTLPSEEPDVVAQRHASLVASLVPDGATLQFGIGRLQTAIVAALTGHRRLRIHSGMVSSRAAHLVDAGAIAGVGAIETGVALGDAAFYERVGADDTFYFRPVSETHDLRRIAAIPDFCAINSAIAVDLFGQVNAECIDGRLVAGAGGLPAFAAGARLAPRGRSIVALSATADRNNASRIVPQLGAGALVTLARHEADFVVTEFGVADLRTRSIHERAQALIQVAAPQFRETLAAEWHAISRRL